MLSFRFDSAASTPASPVIIGPAAYFRMVGTRLLRGPTDHLVARWLAGNWQVGGGEFVRCELHEPLLVQLRDEADSRSLGPLAGCTFVGGALYANGRVYVQFDPGKGLWQLRADESYWPEMILRPAVTAVAVTRCARWTQAAPLQYSSGETTDFTARERPGAGARPTRFTQR